MAIGTALPMMLLMLRAMCRCWSISGRNGAGPCKQLGPVLEKLVKEAGGAVRLVKIDIDQNQDIATQLRIQSIPTVYIFHGGRVLDVFQGVLPESQLRTLLTRLIEVSSGGGGGQAGGPVAELLAQAQALLDTDNHQGARGLYQRLLEVDPENAAAIQGELRCMIIVGELAEARARIAELPEEKRDSPEFRTLVAMIEIAEDRPSGSVSQLRAELTTDGKNLSIGFDLVRALAADGKFEEAIDGALSVIRTNREWSNAEVRPYLLKLLAVMGPEHPLVASARRRLSSILFS